MFNQFIDLFLAICLFGAGGYSVYTAVVSGRWKGLEPNQLLYPSGCTPGQCLDPQGFLRFMRPCLGIFGVLAFLAAVAVLLPYFSGAVPGFVGMAGFLLGVLALGFYMLCLNRGKQRFF